MTPPTFFTALLASISRPIRPVISRLSDRARRHSITVARRAIHALLSSIEVGTLTIFDETADERHTYGQTDTPNSSNGSSSVTTITTTAAAAATVPSPPRAELVVRSDTFWLRVLLLGDMGFAQSYMAGEVECADLTAFFRLFILNRDRLGDGDGDGRAGGLARLARGAVRAASAVMGWWTRSRPNTEAEALRNAAAHYDIGNDVFAAFLSADMTYSCPIWRTGAGSGLDLQEEEPLESAQMTKLRRFVDGARIKETDHVLEIGTGWGSFAIEAVRRTGCRVTSLTLSKEQKGLAEARIAVAGLEGRIEVLLMDYRALPVPETRYDKVVSIEMLEAVGEGFLGTYFACVDRLLKRDGGIAMFQCITMPEGRHTAYSGRKDFINRYIFPGGYLPSVTQLLNHITTSSRGTLIVEKVENIGGHYARTLRLWKENFTANFDEKIRPTLVRQHPDMTQKDIAVFRRKWEYYFTYCEAGFLTKTLGDVIITVGREGAMELMEGIPL